MKNRPCILVLTGCYLPGFRGGGPLRTIFNAVSSLHGDFDFHILTADRDLGDAAPYPGIGGAVWHTVGHARVRYLSPAEQRPADLWRVIAQTDHDLLYLNSFFSPRFTIGPLLGRRLGRLPRRPVLLAPRGEFSRGALGLKRLKKRAYLPVARLGGLVQGVHWEATSPWEAADIVRTIGAGAQPNIIVASNLASPPPERLPELATNTAPTLHVAFVSRISPMKNLDYALAVLRQVAVPVVFNIYGPPEDKAHWAHCQTLMGQLPAHVQALYHGPLTPQQVPAAMAGNDLFFLPTRGENFGHVIAEALSAGLPVLISDTTPWRGLADQSLGWDVPLDQPSQFAACIEACCHKPATEYDAWRKAIRAWAVANIGNQDAIEQNRQLFMNLK